MHEERPFVRIRRSSCLPLVAFLAIGLAACGEDGGPTHARDTTTTVTSASTTAPVASSDGSFALCATRLDFVTATYEIDATTPNSPRSLQVIHEMTPPSGLEADWVDVLGLLDEAVALGVETEAVPDKDLRDRGLHAGQRVDHHVLTTACEPEGLPSDFGCAGTMQQCAEAIADGDLPAAVPPQVQVSVAAGDWTYVSCVPTDDSNTPSEQNWCTLRAKDENNITLASVRLNFAATDDGRLFPYSTNQ